MVCNYYLRTRDKKEINNLITFANKYNDDLQAIIDYFSLENKTIVDIVNYLELKGFEVSYSKRYEKGDIGIGQINLEIKRGNWNDS